AALDDLLGPDLAVREQPVVRRDFDTACRLPDGAKGVDGFDVQELTDAAVEADEDRAVGVEVGEELLGVLEPLHGALDGLPRRDPVAGGGEDGFQFVIRPGGQGEGGAEEEQRDPDPWGPPCPCNPAGRGRWGLAWFRLAAAHAWLRVSSRKGRPY